MGKVKKVVCPHCSAKVQYKKNAAGQWIGTVGGAGAGYVIAGTLGIAGTILGAPIAIPAAIVGGVIGALIGNRGGDAVDRAVAKCPKCGKSIRL